MITLESIDPKSPAWRNLKRDPYSVYPLFRDVVFNDYFSTSKERQSLKTTKERIDSALLIQKYVPKQLWRIAYVDSFVGIKEKDIQKNPKIVNDIINKVGVATKVFSFLDFAPYLDDRTLRDASKALPTASVRTELKAREQRVMEAENYDFFMSKLRKHMNVEGIKEEALKNAHRTWVDVYKGSDAGFKAMVKAIAYLKETENVYITNMAGERIKQLGIVVRSSAISKYMKENYPEVNGSDGRLNSASEAFSHGLDPKPIEQLGAEVQLLRFLRAYDILHMQRQSVYKSALYTKVVEQGKSWHDALDELVKHMSFKKRKHPFIGPDPKRIKQ